MSTLAAISVSAVPVLVEKDLVSTPVEAKPEDVTWEKRDLVWTPVETKPEDSAWTKRGIVETQVETKPDDVTWGH
ncbi:hypothetical protein BGZ83_002738 [Gryganskiella cystojenkinii]|nr:hypothetical protein BGZ83_002738 [Gryganskiella cystojenkinii]